MSSSYGSRRVSASSLSLRAAPSAAAQTRSRSAGARAARDGRRSERRRDSRTRRSRSPRRTRAQTARRGDRAGARPPPSGVATRRRTRARPVHDSGRVPRVRDRDGARLPRARRRQRRARSTLPIKKVAEDVTVGRDKQSAALDPRGNAFSTVLTREQIAALPDDPDEMEAVLKAMAPPGAHDARRRLHAAASCRRSRRFDRFGCRAWTSSPRRTTAASNGMMFIDIMTQPGNGPLARHRSTSRSETTR